MPWLGELFDRRAEYFPYLKLIAVKTAEVLSVTSPSIDSGLGL